MIKKGRKTKQWNKTRAELKKQFAEMNITFCENCGSTFGLSFAHSKKRRHIQGDEIREVALLCVNPCHLEFEALPESEMNAKILEIISKREVYL